MDQKLLAFVQDLITANPGTADALSLAKKALAKKYKSSIPSQPEIINIIKRHQLKVQPELQAWLKKRAVRTMSGIAPVAVLTKDYPCPGRCAYCPKEKEMPRSYLSNEPAVMRAVHCHFDPHEQVTYRLHALQANGHQPDKIELIVIGGTWSYLPTKYKYWFLLECFRAANNYNLTTHNSQLVTQTNSLESLKKELKKEQKRNEGAKHKIIGVTLETRPDFINTKELAQMRELGCTRVEIGVQAPDDKILKINHRDSTVADIIKATALLKNWGFKVTYHIMPALPGSTPSRDLEMYQEMLTKLESYKVIKFPSFAKATADKNNSTNVSLNKLLNIKIENNDFDPDQIKFYPTVVTKGSLLYKWWRAGKYQPYSNQELEKLITECKAITPPFVRIIRLIRDIPSESIMAGNRITNLRQIMQARGIICRCIRCREAKTAPIIKPNLFITKYRASQGDEYFISFENADQSQLYGFLRLRLNENLGPFTKATALVRELHVYGELVPIDGLAKIQHMGLGKKLMTIAEQIAKAGNYQQVAVISGIGVRPYYRKLGFRLNNSYLVKKLGTSTK